MKSSMLEPICCLFIILDFSLPRNPRPRPPRIRLLRIESLKHFRFLLLPLGTGTMPRKSSSPAHAIPVELIERKIYLVRGCKVMFDRDLAELYEVPTKALNQAVRRNIDRFPADFMFQLNAKELGHWRSQIVTSNPGSRMALRRPPLAFTEHGVAMLSSILR